MVKRYVNVWSRNDVVVPSAGGKDGPSSDPRLWDHADYTTPFAENIGAHFTRSGTGRGSRYGKVRHSKGVFPPLAAGHYGLNGPSTWRQYIAPLFPR